MHRFIALSWDNSSSLASADIRRYSSLARAAYPDLIAVEAPGLLVFHDWPRDGPWRHWILPHQTGVVLGQLFERGPLEGAEWRPVVIDAKSAERMAATGGRSLMERFWGTFVAFLADGPHRTRFALRSVGAGIACYRLERRHVDVFFSDVADLAVLEIENLDIDWLTVAGFLQNSQRAGRESALKDVTEVLAGECVRMGLATAQRELLWAPAPFCADPEVNDPRQSVELLRSVTQGCIDLWAGVHRDVLLQLSGGLDSAIVLGCLRHSRVRTRITCFNRYALNPEEDERQFARAATDAAEVPLNERPWEDEDVQLERQLVESPMAPKPTIPALLQIDRRVQQELMITSRAEACWTGQGGDHLFFQFQSPLIVADYLWHRRGPSGLGAVMRDTARLTRQTFWALAVLGARASAARNSARLVDPNPHDTSFVSPEALSQVTAVQTEHPWMASLRRVAPGKHLQVHHLIELLHRHAPFARGRQTIEAHPLISLPLIELCLSIPTWVAVRGGRNRSLAREAFADRLPAAIRERESKGSTGLFLTTAMRRRASMIGELLMDGMLARERLVNRPVIERHLVRAQPLRPGQLFSLFACLAAEVWLRARQRSY